MIYGLFMVFVCIFVRNVNGVKDLPDYFPRCYRNDKELNDCLLKATDQVRPFLQKGVPELGLKPISPFVIPSVTLNQGSASLNYYASLTNFTIYGLDNYRFNKFEFDPESLIFYNEVLMPELYMEGTFKLSGRILAIPIEGKGFLHTNFTDSKGILKVQAALTERKSIKYLEYPSIDTKIIVGNIVDYGIEGLLGDNKSLEKALRAALDENIRELIKEVQPTVENVMTQLFKDYLLKSLSKIPYDRLYPVRKT